MFDRRQLEVDRDEQIDVSFETPLHDPTGSAKVANERPLSRVNVHVDVQRFYAEKGFPANTAIPGFGMSCC